jgi:hypothetical protein
VSDDTGMSSTPRALPFVLVGAFAVLLVGGIALSLATAAPLAQQQLQNAAGNTVAAPSFAIVVTNSVSNLDSSAPSQSTQPTGSETLHVVYQAPDSVKETLEATVGQSPSVIVIGDRLFRENGSQWVESPTSAGEGAHAVATIAAPLQLAMHATNVTRRGDLYRFDSTELSRLSKTVLGVDASQLSSPRLNAQVRNGVVTHELITAVVAHQRLELDLAFSAIGSAPPVQVPRTLRATQPRSGVGPS